MRAILLVFLLLFTTAHTECPLPILQSFSADQIGWAAEFAAQGDLVWNDASELGNWSIGDGWAAGTEAGLIGSPGSAGVVGGVRFEISNCDRFTEAYIILDTTTNYGATLGGEAVHAFVRTEADQVPFNRQGQYTGFDALSPMMVEFLSDYFTFQGTLKRDWEVLDDWQRVGESAPLANGTAHTIRVNLDAEVLKAIINQSGWAGALDFALVSLDRGLVSYYAIHDATLHLNDYPEQ